MSGNMQVTHTICLNGNNLTRQENAIHNPLVTGTYHSTLDASTLKNEIVMRGNEYQRKLESASEIKKMYKCQDCPFSINWIYNLRRQDKGMHKTLVTEKIEYHSKIYVAALKNEIVQCDNEYQMKI